MSEREDPAGANPDLATPYGPLEFVRRLLRLSICGPQRLHVRYAVTSITLSNRSWDVAAGVVAREAGARVLDRDGSEYSTDSSSTVAASPGLSDEVMALVQAAMQAKPSGSPGMVSTLRQTGLA